ncbi:MAG: carbonic anhydrase, partial [Flavobacterium sp.]
MNDFYRKILDNNKIWSQTKLSEDPEYFQKLAAGQSPPLLW